MDYEEIINKIKDDLNEKIDIDYREGSIRYFKEEIKPYGVRIPEIRKIGQKSYTNLKNKLSYKKFFILSENLFKTGWFEDGFLAIYLISKFKEKFTKNEFLIFKNWLKKYVSNWAHCDYLSAGLISVCINNDKNLVHDLKLWVTDKNRWIRRASAVSLVPIVKKNQNIEEAFFISKELFSDKDDLVRKGVGWMLREAGKENEKKVVEFIEKNKKIMPRVTLRYAIERYNKRIKNQLMKRD